MNLNDRFPVTEKEMNSDVPIEATCCTCGAHCDDARLHNEWHDEQERLNEYILDRIPVLSKGKENGLPICQQQGNTVAKA